MIHWAVLNFWKLLLAAIALYAGLFVLIVFGRIVDYIIVFPNLLPIGADGAQRLLILSGQKTIDVWKVRSPGANNREPEAFVLRFVGQADRAERWATATARQWGDKPVEVWAMNYPGSGGSTGPPRLDRLGPSAEETFDALRKVAGSRPIFVQANSLGTAVALCLAARRPVAGLILNNPAPLRQVIMDRYGWWILRPLARAASEQIPSELDAIANASRSKVPAIIIHSEKDTSIRPNVQRLVGEAYQGPKREIVVLGAGHMSPLTPTAKMQFAEDLQWLCRAAAESH